MSNLDEKLEIQKKLLRELMRAARRELMLGQLLGYVGVEECKRKLEYLEKQYKKSLVSLRLHAEEARKRGWDITK